MENLQLIQIDKKRDISPYFITIYKSEDRKVKIPCVNEAIAKKVLAGLGKKITSS